MTLSRTLLFSLATSLLTSSLLAQSDNFNDNTIGQQWSVLQDNAALSVNEANQRREVTANAPTNPNFDALYLSNGPAGFLLSTSANFQISIDYNFTAATPTGNPGDALALVFGIGRDLPNGTDSAAIGFGYANVGTASPQPQLVGNSRTGDIPAEPTLLTGGSSTGTFRISYNAAGDDLTFSVVGNPDTYQLNDTARTIWGADSLYVSFGARGNGFNVSGSDAYFDNFSAVPEPSTNLLLALGIMTGAIVLRRRTNLSAQ